MSPLRLAAAAALTIANPGSIAAQPAAAPGELLVTVWSYGFAPHPIHLAAGRPVTLTFTNRSGSGHDFTAGEFFRNAHILSGPGASGEIELRPHQSRTVTLVPRAGSYPAHCSHFFHQQLGMSDRIIVD
jgi:plastocyanin